MSVAYECSLAGTTGKLPGGQFKKGSLDNVQPPAYDVPEYVPQFTRTLVIYEYLYSTLPLCKFLPLY